MENDNMENDKMGNDKVKKNHVYEENRGSVKIRKVIYYILGVIEVLLVFRFFLKVLGANPDSTFVTNIYSVTNVFLVPFAGIFRKATSTGIETQSVLEPTLIIAMIVYGAIAWGIAKLIEISFNHKETKN